MRFGDWLSERLCPFGHWYLHKLNRRILELMSAVDDLVSVTSGLASSVSALEASVQALIAGNPGGVPADDPRVVSAVNGLRSVKDRVDSLLASIPVA